MTGSSRRAKRRQKLGWRFYKIQIPVAVVRKRLVARPIATVREKMHIHIFDGFLFVSYHGGFYGGDEIECGRWILCSHVPRKWEVSEKNEALILDWVRETV